MVDAATGAETVLHRFNNADGWLPQAMLAYWNGVFYGTTGGGGASGGGLFGKGTIFAVDPATGEETVLHSFDGNDGEGPSGLIYGGGAFYGFTGGGSTACLDGYGTVFKFTP